MGDGVRGVIRRKYCAIFRREKSALPKLLGRESKLGVGESKLGVDDSKLGVGESKLLGREPHNFRNP